MTDLILEYVVRYYDEILGTWKEIRWGYEGDAATNAAGLLAQGQIHGLTYEVQDVTNGRPFNDGKDGPKIRDIDLSLSTLTPEQIATGVPVAILQRQNQLKTAAQKVLANPLWQANPPTPEQFAALEGGSDVIKNAVAIVAESPSYKPILEAVGADLKGDDDEAIKAANRTAAMATADAAVKAAVDAAAGAGGSSGPGAVTTQSFAGNVWKAIEDVVDVVRTALGKATTYVMVSLYENFKLIISRSRVEAVLYAYSDAERAGNVSTFGGMNDPNAKTTVDYLVSKIGGDPNEVYNILFCLKEGADKGDASCGTIIAGTGLSVLDTLQHKGVTGAIAETVTSVLEGFGIPAWVGTALLVGAVVGVLYVAYRYLLKPIVRTA
jgi:hypothetical protein